LGWSRTGTTTLTATFIGLSLVMSTILLLSLPLLSATKRSNWLGGFSATLSNLEYCTSNHARRSHKDNKLQSIANASANDTHLQAIYQQHLMTGGPLPKLDEGSL
jgi:hypothetical protein